MRVAVFGLGYVGCVTGACIADLGHLVVGVDVNPLKVQMMNDGNPPVIEDGLAEFISKVNARGTLTATGDWLRAVCEADVSLVCVGTPSNENGSLSLDVVRRVTAQIGEGLKNRRDYSVVAIRSTVLPGTVESELIPLLEEHSGKTAGRDFGVCMVPEFLREGSSLHDFFHPPKCVIGQLDQRSGDTVAALFE
ncbi:MAG TPA: nucleotide sugar dehydrogenase, partial [Nitrospiraceae bacterium]